MLSCLQGFIYFPPEYCPKAVVSFLVWWKVANEIHETSALPQELPPMEEGYDGYEGGEGDYDAGLGAGKAEARGARRVAPADVLSYGGIMKSPSTGGCTWNNKTNMNCGR